MATTRGSPPLIRALLNNVQNPNKVMKFFLFVNYNLLNACMDSDNELTKLVAFCTFAHHNLLGGGGVVAPLQTPKRVAPLSSSGPVGFAFILIFFYLDFPVLKQVAHLSQQKKLKIKKNNIGVYYLFALT